MSNSVTLATRRSSSTEDFSESRCRILTGKCTFMWNKKQHSVFGLLPAEICCVKLSMHVLIVCLYALACAYERVQYAGAWVVIQNIKVVGAQSVTQTTCCSLRLCLTWPKGDGGFVFFWEYLFIIQKQASYCFASCSSFLTCCFRHFLGAQTHTYKTLSNDLVLTILHAEHDFHPPR